MRPQPSPVGWVVLVVVCIAALPVLVGVVKQLVVPLAAVVFLLSAGRLVWFWTRY